MEQSLRFDTQSVIGRSVNNEFVVVSLKSGDFFHFNRETEEFLKHFQSPTRLSDVVSASKVEGAEKEYLENFCGFLVTSEILSKLPETSATSATASDSYARPEFLRVESQKLDRFPDIYP